jgi:hypothetical protein
VFPCIHLDCSHVTYCDHVTRNLHDCCSHVTYCDHVTRNLLIIRVGGLIELICINLEIQIDVHLPVFQCSLV